MHDTQTFALVILTAAAAAVAVLGLSHVAVRIRVPLPALMLIASTAVAAVTSHSIDEHAASRIVTVALVVLLFDGGMGIGRRRLAGSTGPVVILGVAGTFLTTGIVAAAAHVLFGFDWYSALLVATAVAPTDPAVVFSVLGRKRVRGRAGTILEGESGANDPVGIALMAALVSAGHLSLSSAGTVAVTFIMQLGIGAVCGWVGATALLLLMRRTPLPSEGLYPLRTLAGSLLIYGATAVAHGSGFLAVLVAGVLIGDERAPYKREIERFHGAVGSLGEMVAFVTLGLTVDVHQLAHGSVWAQGVGLWAVMAVIGRPVVVRVCLLASKLPTAERRFVAFAGLKGAVPILLGGYIISGRVPGAPHLYAVVVAMVVLSVVFQGGLTGTVAAALRLPVEETEPQPWSFGVRLRTAPEETQRITVEPGSAADGAAVADLDGLPPESWLALLVRDGSLVAVRGDTVLRAGDQLTVIGATDPGALERVFGRP